MDTITGTVQKILWAPKDPENHFKVFKLRSSTKKYETVTGDFPDLIEGAEIEIHGDFKDHPRYGRGFRATAHNFTFNRDSVTSVALYLQSIAKFIGPQRAYAIASIHTKDLDEVIEKNPEKLLEIKDIGRKVVSQLVTAWATHKEEKNVRIFLHSLGLTEFRIKKILSTLGISAEEKIKENPFLLSMFGFGFSTCDFIAKKLKIDPKSPVRYRYFVLYILKEVTTSGHLYLTLDQLVRAFNKYQDVAPLKFKDSYIVEKDIIPHLKQLIAEGHIIQEGDSYYDIDLFFFENESAHILKRIKDTKDMCHTFGDINIDEHIKEYEEKQKQLTGIDSFSLSDAQKDAVRSFMDEKIMIITGSPGTGKTTVLRAFVDICIDHHLSFELLTPTGIAAKKLANTAGYEAYTIHRRFSYNGDGWGNDVFNKYNTDVIIVDEMSMVDMELFYRLVSAVYHHTKLIFVGDNDQLPSVGPGRVLNELIQSKQFKTIFLKDIFRQAEQSDIIKQAKKIKEGNLDLSLLSEDPKSDIWFIGNSKLDWIESRIIDFAQKLKQRMKNSKEKKTFQLITPRNTGPLSVETLNVAMQKALNPKTEDQKEVSLGNNLKARIGDRVLIKKNNYQFDIFNGDIGKILDIRNGLVILSIDDFTGYREIDIPLEQVQDILKLGYAISVHKSQGSEYDLVLMPIVRNHGKKILQRNLLYTGLTRAKKKVIIIGQSSAVVDAIENDKIQNRNTKFGERVKRWIIGKGTTLQELYKNPNDYHNAPNLKRLLLYEEKTSSGLDTTKKSYAESQENEKMTNTISKPTPSSKPQNKKPLGKLLSEIETMIEETEDLPF